MMDAVESNDDVGDRSGSILSVLAQLAMGLVTTLVVFGGTIPYYFQCREMKRSQNASGFSLHVCLTLLIANILRILFWWGRHFELPLLWQSVVMIICMLYVVHTSVQVQAKQSPPAYQQRTIWNSHLVEQFWRWTDFASYLAALIAFAAVATAATALLLGQQWYTETLGFAALFLESNLATPQLWQNFKRKSTVGMSLSMVIMWLLGDISKTGYFLARNAPAQFWTCGLLQVFVDILIIMQTKLYQNQQVVIIGEKKPDKSSA